MELISSRFDNSDTGENHHVCIQTNKDLSTSSVDGSSSKACMHLL
jgi:hypothetical protein